MSESFATPYSQIIPAYPYRQYAADQNVAAFFTSLNTIQQGILTWFAETPLSVYTSPNISGTLLDWTLTGIYGIARPILADTSTASNGALGTDVLGTHPLATLTSVQSGTAQFVSDDIYKRVATWILYRGDGNQFTLPWLARRVRRFLFGVNGADVPVNVDWQGANLLSYSVPTTTNWGAGANVTCTNNAAGAPDGTTTAELVVPTTATAQHTQYSPHPTIAAGAVICGSIFIKAAGYPRVFLVLGNTAFSSGINATFNVSTGQLVGAISSSGTATITGGGIIPVGNGWYRVWLAGAVDATSTAALLVPYVDNGVSEYFAGDGTSGILQWGAQIEEGTSPSSYKPTNGYLPTVSVVPDAPQTIHIYAPFSNSTSATFQQLMQQGYLPTPLPYNVQVTVR